MKHCLLILLFAHSIISSYGQTSYAKATERSIVMDSDGMVYPYKVWKMLVMQGDYEVQPTNEQKSFLLVKISEEQKDRRFERMSKPGESRSFRTGKAFGSFKTFDINTNKIDLKKEKGKIIVLNFWFINCPPCRMEIPALNELVTAFEGNDNIKFIGIALDPKSDLQDFLKILPFKYTIVSSGQDLARRYNIEAYPTHVIIDQQGNVYFHTVGVAPNTVYWLKRSVNELLSQSAVSKSGM